MRNFAAMLETAELARAQKIPVAVIGPQTAQTARQLGFTVAVEPAAATLEAMIEAIIRYFQALAPNPEPPATKEV